MKLPLVSIVVTFYQAERYVKRQVAALMALTYPCLELIIVDNASKDETCLLIEDLLPTLSKKFQRVEFIKLTDNLGPSAGFNAGVAQIAGDYFVQTDGDDFIRPEAVSEMVTHALENDVTAVQGFANYYDGETKCLISRHQVTTQSNLLETLLGVNTIFNPGTRLIQTQAFREMYPDSKIYDSAQGQNWQILIPFILKHELDVLPVIVLDVSRWPNSHSTRERTFDDVMKRVSEFNVIWESAISVAANVIDYKKELQEAYAQHLFTTAYEYRQVKHIAEALRAMRQPTIKQRLKYVKAVVGK